jgi:hypothetical protein
MMNTEQPYQMIKLDVSDLAAPQPMTEIIKALAALTDQQFLRVRHRREPFPLYEKLVAAGWLYFCQQKATGSFDIYIYKAPMHQYVTQLPTILSKG